MMTHLKILAWFNVVLGALGLLAGAAIFGGAMVVSDIFQYAVEDAGVPAAVLQLVALVVTTVVLVVSLPCLILGYGLINLRPWARVLGIVLAALNLLNVPFGTAVSLYAFWVLLKPETAALFRSAPAAG
ncbi:MAG: hypothetical protein C0504_04860 [Candidatus Solibacter sp.]|nr:hypothetical protein [Candidatus Solibacter sp.]